MEGAGAGAGVAGPSRPRSRPSRPSLRYRRDSSDDSDGDSSTGNDDGCIYTYRGGAPAAEPEPASPPPEPPSSPDMDFLEMDFEPSPPADSGAEGDGAPLRSPHSPAASDRSFRSNVSDESDRSADNERETYSPKENLPGTSRSPDPTPHPLDTPTDECVPNGETSKLIPHLTIDDELIYVKRTTASWFIEDVFSHHSSSGDLVSPGEVCEGGLPESFSWNCAIKLSPGQNNFRGIDCVNLSSTLFHCTMAKKLVVDKHSAKFLQAIDTSNVDGENSFPSKELPVVPKCMLWSEQEASSKQVTQIGSSACGATAVINALLALQQRIDLELVTSSVNTRLRANNASLCPYIISRSIAGCGVKSLAAGLHAGSNGAVSSRFFSMWPERIVSLSHWLAYWIGLGAVPIATLNLQSGILNPNKIPDSWHHQMIFGVGPRGIYMANPVDCVEEGVLWHQLCSDSVLLIKRKDILNRWTADTDLSPLMYVPGDERWKTMNVLGQVVNIIRESQQNPNDTGPVRTTHIKIPACYEAGITIAVLTGSEAHKKLLQASDLPVHSTED